MRESLAIWVAWRHLRARQSRTWTRVAALLFAYVCVVGIGFMVWARLRGGIAEEVASGPMVDFFIPPIADLAGMIGLVTLALGLLGLTFALLTSIFNLLSAIIIVSVAQGCMALVVVLSLMTGLELDLQAKIIKQSAEIRITHVEDEPFADYRAIAAAIGSLEEVAAVSPYAQGEVMLRSRYNRQGGLLVGVVPDAHARVSNLEEQIDQGAYRFLSDPGGGPWAELDRRQREREETAKRAIEAQQRRSDVDSLALPQVDQEIREEDPQADDDDAGGWQDAAELLSDETGEEAIAKPAENDRKDGDNVDDDGGDWEDPEIEIPKLRAAGELASTEMSSGSGSETNIETNIDSPVAVDPPASPAEAEEGPAGVLVPLLIGAELSEELSVPLGGRIQLITPIGRMTPSGQVPSFLAVRAVGIFYSGMYAYDRQNVYAPLDRVQALLRLDERVHGIEVKLVDSDLLDAAVGAIRGRLDTLGRRDLRVETWRSLNKNLFSAMFLEKIAMFIGLLFV
ncbi:MAG TPA: hypothetical protein ENJ18_17850, partial [Nannocystis exedens]|nr:hypothetical protein [Nannocystis exedens]